MTAEDLYESPPRGELRESCIPVLETSRLVLRAPRLEDAVAIAGLANNRSIAAMAARIPYPYGIKDAEQWIHKAWTGPDCPFVIVHRTTGAVMGAVGFNTCETGQVSLGYWLGIDHHGQGYASEAVRALVDYLFSARGVTAIAASCRVVNNASRHVLEKCAFQWTGAGLVRSSFLQSSVPVDHFRLERRVWASLKSWTPASMSFPANDA
jgi:RimJ/RimL family protein N-acetyltransferase